MVFRVSQKWRQHLAVPRGNTVMYVEQFFHVVFTFPDYSFLWDSRHLYHTIHSSKCLTIRKVNASSRNPTRVIRPHSLLNWSWTIFWDCVIQTCMLMRCRKACEICPAHSLPNGIGYTARKRKRLSTAWLWVIKLLYSWGHGDASHWMVNLFNSKNQELFSTNLLIHPSLDFPICQNSHRTKTEGKRKEN